MPLTVATWNCFGAAQDVVAFMRWRGIPEAHRLSDPDVTETFHAADVLCLQEVFLSEAEEFFEQLPHAHKTRDPNGAVWWPMTFGGSGLALASRYKIVHRATRTFSGRQVGAERFARKGALFARLAIDDSLEIDVATTHMQSGYESDAVAVRKHQVLELRELVDKLGSPDRPFIVCGDFNVNGLEQVRAHEYEHLARIFSDFRDADFVSDRPTFHPHPDKNHLAHRYDPGAPVQRIDYVLFRPARGARLSSVDRVLDVPLAAGTFASDHYGLRASIEW